MTPTPDSAGAFRWQAFFQHAAEPLFLLSAHRRLRFANRAWEALTGLSLRDVRGRPCRRRAREQTPEREDAILAALAPPPEALAGRIAEARRRSPISADGWWQMSFVPISGDKGVLAILGKIAPLGAAEMPVSALPERLMALRDRLAAEFRLDRLISDQPAMRRVVEQAKLAAASLLPLTLVGTAGAGKQWLARAIHAAGPACHAYFACLDGVRLPPGLVEDLLFGPRATRMTIGTLLLREPAAIPRELQARLAQRLRSDSAVTPRLILAYRNDPATEVRSGRLLDDLHCLTSALTINLPPLRERRDDLAALVDHLIARGRSMQSHAITAVSLEALDALRAYDWPGNLRELAQILHTAAARAKKERIELADLPFHLRHGPLPVEKALPLDALLAETEKRLILLALRKAKNNRSRAAELLGIWRPRLLRRFEHFGIDPGAEPGESNPE